MALTMRGWFTKKSTADTVKPFGDAPPRSPTKEAFDSESPAWLRGGVYKSNDKVGNRLPIAFDGTQGLSSPGARHGNTTGMGKAGEGGTRKLRSTLELPEGQVQIMVEPEAARIWGAIREVSEILIEKALLCGEADLVSKFRQELAVLQIRNPGLIYSDHLCNLLNDLSHVDLPALPRQRGTLALQKILLTMQELAESNLYKYAPEGLDPNDVSQLPASMLPDLAIYLQEYKKMAEEAKTVARQATQRAEEAEEALQSGCARVTGLLNSGSMARTSPSFKATGGNKTAAFNAALEADEEASTGLRRAEMQLDDLMVEADEKRTKYQEIINKIEEAKAEIAELDGLLKSGGKDSEAKLRQLLQKQNNAAVAVGLNDGEMGVSRCKSVRKGTGKEGLVALLDSTYLAIEANEYEPNGALGDALLAPDSPEVLAYVVKNYEKMEDQTSRHVVKHVIKVLKLDGNEDEMDGMDEWRETLGLPAQKDDQENEDEDEDEDEEDEDDDEEEEEEDDEEEEDEEDLEAAAEAEDRAAVGILAAEIKAAKQAKADDRKIDMIINKMIKHAEKEAGEDTTPKKTVLDAETQVQKMLAFMQSRMEARAMALSRLMSLWDKLQVPEQTRKAVLLTWDGLGSESIAGLQSEVRRLEDKLSKAREREQKAQSNALRNTILMVDTLEPKWAEMEAQRAKAKTLKAIPANSKEAERMMAAEAKNVLKAEQRAVKKRSELFDRFLKAARDISNLNPELLEKFKEEHTSLAPTNLAELGRMVEFVELKARVPQMKPLLDQKKRELKIIQRNRGMDKKMRKEAVKVKKGEMKEHKMAVLALRNEIKDAAKGMVGIVTSTYLKKQKKETAKGKKKAKLAADKQKTLRVAKEALKKDVKASGLELERKIWRMAAMKTPGEEKEGSTLTPPSAKGGRKSSAKSPAKSPSLTAADIPGLTGSASNSNLEEAAVETLSGMEGALIG